MFGFQEIEVVVRGEGWHIRKSLTCSGALEIVFEEGYYFVATPKELIVAIPQDFLLELSRNKRALRDVP